MKIIDSKILNINRFGTEVGCQLTDAVFFVTDGSFSLKAGGREEIVSKNEIVFFPGDMFFERYILSPLSFYYVKLSGKENLPCGKVDVHDRSRLHATFRLLDLSYRAGEKDMANHFLSDIFIQLEAEKKCQFMVGDRITEEAIRYLEENVKNKISISDLTSSLGVCSTSLIEHFKKNTGHTPFRFLNLLRISIAEKLLVTTDLTLGEIAVECGFDTPFYLSNVFKKEKGISPRIYRRFNRV